MATEDLPLLQWPNRATELLSELSHGFRGLITTLSDAPEQTCAAVTTQVQGMAQQIHQRFHSLHVYLRVNLAGTPASKQKRALSCIFPALLSFSDCLPAAPVTSIQQPHTDIVYGLLYDVIMHLAAVSLAAVDLGCVEQAQCLSLSLLRVAMTSQLANSHDSTGVDNSVSKPFQVVLFWIQKTLGRMQSEADTAKQWGDLVLHVVAAIAQQYAVTPSKLW
jgi:hypothetical protein